MTDSKLALDGGPQAVTADMGDSWETVTSLEKEFVNAVLDHMAHEARPEAF